MIEGTRVCSKKGGYAALVWTVQYSAHTRVLNVMPWLENVLLFELE